MRKQDTFWIYLDICCGTNSAKYGSSNKLLLFPEDNFIFQRVGRGRGGAIVDLTLTNEE